jgi:hypothetical protein
MDLHREQELTCPACGEPISVLVDTSVPFQTYVEDCEVCCRPLLISVRAEDGLVVGFEARREDD